MKPTCEPWAPERVEELVRLVRSGLSGGRIAKEMGITTAAVAGRIHRLRMETGDESLRCGYSVGRIWHPPSNKPLPERTRQSLERLYAWKARNGGAVVVALRSVQKHQGLSKKQKRRLEASTMISNGNVVSPHPVHFSERREYVRFGCIAMGRVFWKPPQCAWPLWDDNAPYSKLMCCGNATTGAGPYCAAHQCMAHDNRVRGSFVPGPGSKWRNKTMVSPRGQWEHTIPNWAIKERAA